MSAAEQTSAVGHRYKVAKRLGVASTLSGTPDSALAVHEALHAGLPRRALLKSRALEAARRRPERPRLAVHGAAVEGRGRVGHSRARR